VWGLHALGFLDNGIGLRDQPWVIRRQNLARLMELECEDRIGTGPPRARTDVIYVDLGNWAISGSTSHNGFSVGCWVLGVGSGVRLDEERDRAEAELEEGEVPGVE